MSIYRVDDGSTWHFDAPSREAARAQWVAASLDFYGHASEADVVAVYGEPQVELVQMNKAAAITVTTEDETDCSHCGGRGRVPLKKSLLECYQENQRAEPDKKAKHGALCNSEWP